MGVPRRQLLAGFLLVRFVCARGPRKRIILMLGPPGSGKTTQSERLKSALGLPVVSMTDMLQSEGVGKGRPNRNLSAQIATGDIVSDEVANSLLRKRISRKDCERGFILDGYPFTAKQAEYFEGLLRELGLPRPAVIHLSITDYAVDQRLAKRGREEDSPANTELRIVMYRKQAELLMPRYPDAITVDASSPLTWSVPVFAKLWGTEGSGYTAKMRIPRSVLGRSLCARTAMCAGFGGLKSLPTCQQTHVTAQLQIAYFYGKRRGWNRRTGFHFCLIPECSSAFLGYEVPA